MADNMTERNNPAAESSAADVGKKTTDAETLRLIEQVKLGDEAAFAVLAERYRTVTDSAAARAAGTLNGMDGSAMSVDDLRQEATLSLYKAARTYDGSMADKVTFGLYAKICARNAMISLIRRESAAMRRRRRGSAEEAYSADSATRMADAAEAAELLSLGKETLSGYERAVLDEYISGKTAREIARDVGQTPKSVSNAIYRIKVKLRKAAASRILPGK